MDHAEAADAHADLHACQKFCGHRQRRHPLPYPDLCCANALGLFLGIDLGEHQQRGIERHADPQDLFPP